MHPIHYVKNAGNRTSAKKPVKIRDEETSAQNLSMRLKMMPNLKVLEISFRKAANIAF